MVSAELINNIPLFEGIAPDDVDGVLWIGQRVQFEPGAYLIKQGQPADSAFILESGAAEVITALPGGGALTVAQLRPGSVIGEMALLDRGVRSASVVARDPVAGFFLERDAFRMLLAQRNDAAFKVQHRITLALCHRLRELNAKLVANDSARDSRSGMRVGTSRGSQTSFPGRIVNATSSSPRRDGAGFDYQPFLPILPAFRRFHVDEIHELINVATVFEMPRGAVMFSEDAPADAAHIVVRGAVEITRRDGVGVRHRIGILGPGRLCGVMALIGGEPHSTTATAREHVTLLELKKAVFDRLFQGRDHLAARFQDAINQDLLQALSHTNNHLTRLISQARIRARSDARFEVEELQRALCTQDCRTA